MPSMGCCCGKESTLVPQWSYCSPKGNIITFPGPPIQHDATAEYDFVKSNDTRVFKQGDCCYLVDSMWLKQWGDFASKTSEQIPEAIDNSSLLNDDRTNINPSKRIKVDFRPISEKVWEHLFGLYGGGPVVFLKG